MAEQETLTGQTSSEHGGLWARFLSEGAINEAAWRNTCDNGGFVGTCSPCGGYLKPRQPEKRDRRLDFAAECTSCGREICAPGGRIHKRKRGH